MVSLILQPKKGPWRKYLITGYTSVFALIPKPARKIEKQIFSEGYLAIKVDIIICVFF